MSIARRHGAPRRKRGLRGSRISLTLTICQLVGPSGHSGSVISVGLNALAVERPVVMQVQSRALGHILPSLKPAN
jgi:hypothetical protein